jgi:hypothetical protein
LEDHDFKKEESAKTDSVPTDPVASEEEKQTTS